MAKSGTDQAAGEMHASADAGGQAAGATGPSVSEIGCVAGKKVERSGKTHRYHVALSWTGNLGEGTRSYRGYSRDHELAAPGKPTLAGSSDPAFRGDPARWNPEELLVASASACHQLWYLHLCAVAGVVVVDYRDEASGEMIEEANGAGQFECVLLRPTVTIAAGGDVARALALHEKAHEMCFIARSILAPVLCEATILTA